MELNNLKRFHESLVNFDRAINIAPNLALAYSNISKSKFYLGDYFGALQDISKAVELSPNDLNIRENFIGIKTAIPFSILHQNDDPSPLVLNEYNFLHTVE